MFLIYTMDSVMSNDIQPSRHKNVGADDECSQNKESVEQFQCGNTGTAVKLTKQKPCLNEYTFRASTLIHLIKTC